MRSQNLRSPATAAAGPSTGSLSWSSPSPMASGAGSAFAGGGALFSLTSQQPQQHGKSNSYPQSTEMGIKMSSSSSTPPLSAFSHSSPSSPADFYPITSPPACSSFLSPSTSSTAMPSRNPANSRFGSPPSSSLFSGRHGTARFQNANTATTTTTNNNNNNAVPAGSPIHPSMKAVPSTSTQAVQQENDHLIAALLGNVRSTRRVAESIGQEIQSQNALLEQLQHLVGAASASLNRTLRRVNKFANSNSSYMHFWVLLVFVFIVFMFVYCLLRSTR